MEVPTAPPPLPPPLPRRPPSVRPFPNEETFPLHSFAATSITAAKRQNNKQPRQNNEYYYDDVQMPLVQPQHNKNNQHIYHEIDEARKYDLLFAQPHLRILRFNPSIWLIWSAVIVVNIGLFIILMLFRQFPDNWLTVAKNAAIMTALNFTILGFTINHVYSNKETWIMYLHRSLAIFTFVFAIVHIVGHIVLLVNILEDVTDQRVEISEKEEAKDYVRTYIYDRLVFYITGLGMIIALSVLLSCASRGVRKRHYNVFYYTHIIGVAAFIFIGTIHSVWYLFAIFYPLMFIYMPRILRRWYVKYRINTVNFGSDYAIVTLVVYHNWFKRLLLLGSLWKDMRDVWIVCPEFGQFERHPFTVIEVEKHDGYTLVKLLIWRYGDWKSRVVRHLKSSQKIELHSYGLQIAIDEARISDLMTPSALKSNNILFILENAGISSFIAFSNYIWSMPTVQDRARNIVLHYRIDDSSIFDLLSETLNRLRSIPSIHVEAHIYTSIATLFENKITQQTTRLDYKRILKSFFCVTDTGKSDARRLALENGSLFVYSNDEALRERIVRQLRLWIKQGYYEGCDNDPTRFINHREINIIL
nr:ferric reductase like transmembrane component [Apis mellifera nudivirus]